MSAWRLCNLRICRHPGARARVELSVDIDAGWVLRPHGRAGYPAGSGALGFVGRAQTVENRRHGSARLLDVNRMPRSRRLRS